MTNLDPRLKSKVWRLNNLYKVKNKQGGLVTFRPNAIQLQHIIDRGNHRRNLILKARQLGFTTLYCIDLLDEALWVPGMTCAILAHEREALLKIFEIVKRAYENLPDSIKPTTRTDTKNAYGFTSRYDGATLDSSIYVALKLRSGTVQKLHITESAFVDDRQELVAGSKQTVPISGWISEETTGNGFNEFYDFFEQEDNKQQNLNEMDYKTYFYPWYENPEYELNTPIVEKTKEEIELQSTYPQITDNKLSWRRWKIQELSTSRAGEGISLSGEQLFKQEYPATKSEAFQSGAGNVFNIEKVEKIQVREPLQHESIVELTKQGVRVYKLVEQGKEYFVGVDPSDGTGGDNGAIAVWDREYNKVADFLGQLQPDQLAQLAVDMAEYFNHAYVGVENNMLSTVLFLSMIYDNYYFSTVIDEVSNKQTKKPGWNTNSKSRNVMIDDFLILFRENNLNINSKITQSQMKTFVTKENGKREHANGKNDDMLFADFIAIQIMKYKPVINTYDYNPLE